MTDIPWWKKAVAYQVYPRSFQDSNGDGIGDLGGLIDRLDYLRDLGVDVIWICPMYRSPQDDNGYDISDYQDIDPQYGTLFDFDRLLNEVHRRGMKLIIDLVINHTSDEHAWFVESRSSRDNPKRDWYLWRDAKAGREPNNWESIFGGSAWQWDAKTEQYYLHLFSVKQPDLNWENRDMRRAVYEMIQWWITRGVDGFRLDAISHMKKEPRFADLPNPEGLAYVPSFASHMNVDGIQGYLTDLCREALSKPGLMTVGEANGVSATESLTWVGESEKKLNMLFQFEHLDLWSMDREQKIDLAKVKEVFTRWQTTLHGRGWNALYLENHDIPRIVSKWGDEEKYWRDSATCLAVLYFLMEGTPFIYQGQEIGMTNTTFSRPEDFDDVRARNLFRENRARGISDAQSVAALGPVSRDNARTPMQWSSAPGAGFTKGRPWLKVNPNFEWLNVESQIGKPDSVLEFYRKLIQLRKAHDVFVTGEYHLIEKENPQIYAYERRLGEKVATIVCNLSSRTAAWTDPRALCVLTNKNKSGDLAPFEARVYL